MSKKATEPDRVAGEQILVVNEVDHMPPCVAGDEEAFDLDAINVEQLAVMQQNLFVVDRDLRQLVQAIDHLAAHLAREIPVLNLADVQLCIFEKSGAVRLDRTDMVSVLMGQAQEKAERLHLKNVTFRQGDVGALPYANDTFDIVLSLNGFHAFPDKEAAFRETFRVLKPGGTFCGCFYVKGEQKRTDWFVRHIYEKAGFFTDRKSTRLNSSH
mgnify:CR=1 FL=1